MTDSNPDKTCFVSTTSTGWTPGSGMAGAIFLRYQSDTTNLLDARTLNFAVPPIGEKNSTAFGAVCHSLPVGEEPYENYMDSWWSDPRITGIGDVLSLPGASGAAPGGRRVHSAGANPARGVDNFSNLGRRFP